MQCSIVGCDWPTPGRVCPKDDCAVLGVPNEDRIQTTHNLEDRMKRSMTGLAAAILLAATRAFATGAPDVQWTKTFAGVGQAEGCYVEQTTDGGYFAVGTTYSDNWQTARLLLVKLNSSGDTTWTRTISGPGRIEAYSAQQIADGYVVGVNGGLVDTTRPDVYLMKVDGLGNFVWQTNLSGGVIPRGAKGYSVVQTNDGGYAVSASGFPSDTAILLFRTDGLGDRQWFRRYAVGIDDWCYDRISLSRTSDGGYIIGAKKLIKVDSEGNPEWMKSLGVAHSANSAIQTSDGGYVQTGPTWGWGSIYLKKWRADGSSDWLGEYAYGEPSSSDWVERTSDGGFVVAGGYKPSSSVVAAIVRTTSSGTHVWTDSLFRGGATCVRQTLDGGYIATGCYWEPTPGFGKSFLFLTKLAPEQKRGKR